MPERNLPPDLSQWVVQALSRWLATYAIMQGLFIVVGGPQRWQSPGLATAMSVPGAPASWGWVLSALGVITLASTFRPRPRAATAALLGIGAWSFFFAISLARSVAQDERVATTGVFIYGHCAVAACILAVAYWQAKR